MSSPRRCGSSRNGRRCETRRAHSPHQAWFTSSAAADRYVAGYAPDVLRHAVTVVGPVEVEER